MSKVQASPASRKQGGDGRAKPSTLDPQLSDDTRDNSSLDHTSIISASLTPPAASYQGPTPRYHIIPPSPFLDTFAILIILLQLPTWLTVSIQLIYIGALSPNFKWNALPFTKNAGAAHPPNKHKPSIVRILAVDFLFAILTLYFTPILRNVMLVFAQAIVASTLGGNQKASLHAIYATTIVETITIFWNLLCDRFQLENSYSHLFLLSITPSLLKYNIPAPKISSTTPYSVVINESSVAIPGEFPSFPTVIGILQDVDWLHEFPCVILQMIAIYVIWLGLSSFLRGDFLSTDSTDSAPSSSAPAASTFANGNAITRNSAKLTTQSGPIGPTDMKEDYCTTYSEEDMVTISVSSEVAGSHEKPEELAPVGESYLYPNKKSKKVMMVRANQPLWYTLARSMVMTAKPEHMPNAQPQPHQQLDHFIRKRRQNSCLPHDISGCFLLHVLENFIGFLVADVIANTPPQQYTVRVNNVQWKQTTITYVNVTEDAILPIDMGAELPVELENSSTMILITVNGLTEGTIYHVEISQASEVDPVILCKTKVCTAKSKTNNGIVSSRPLSPITTLLNTLAQLQLTLAEAKANIKKARKENSRKINNMRTEIEQIRVKSENSNRADERMYRKVLALRSTVKQLENEIKSTQEENDRLQIQTQDSTEEHKSRESEWIAGMKTLEDSRKAKNNAKEEINKKLAQIELDRAALIEKRNKWGAKRDKYASDISQMEAAIDTAIEQELARRKQAREEKMRRRSETVKEFSGALNIMESGALELQHRRQCIMTSLADAPHMDSQPSASTHDNYGPQQWGSSGEPTAPNVPSVAPILPPDPYNVGYSNNQSGRASSSPSMLQNTFVTHPNARYDSTRSYTQGHREASPYQEYIPSSGPSPGLSPGASPDLYRPLSQQHRYSTPSPQAGLCSPASSQNGLYSSASSQSGLYSPARTPSHNLPDPHV